MNMYTLVTCIDIHCAYIHVHTVIIHKYYYRTWNMFLCRSNLCNIVYDDSFSRLHAAAIQCLPNLNVHVCTCTCTVITYNVPHAQTTTCTPKEEFESCMLPSVIIATPLTPDLPEVKTECPVLHHQMPVQ